MQTREQAEQNLGLGKKVNAQLEELKSLENRLNLKLDTFLRILEEKRNLSVSVAHRHQIEKVEEIEKLNKLLSEEVQEIKIKAEDKAIIQGFEGKVSKAIENIKSNLKVPKFLTYVWISCFLMLLCSGLFYADAMKSKQDIISIYLAEQEKEGKILSPKLHTQVFKDVDQWFIENPNNFKAFTKWRKNKENKK